MIAKSVMVHQVKDVRIIETELDPEMMSSDECLIETAVSLISAGTELSRVFGLKKGAVYPTAVGYCSVGKVLKKGANVKGVDTGDMVLFSGPHSSIQLYDPAKSDGGVLYKLNKETTPKEGSFLMMCWIAMNGILPADVKLGDSVAILGMGTLGLVLSVYYKQMGAKVIALDPVKERCEKAKAMGADFVVDCESAKQVEAVMEITDGKGADIVVDASGLSPCVETGIQIAAKYGQVLLLGSPRVDYTCNVTPIFNAIHMKMLTVIGSFNRRYPYTEKEGSRLCIEKSMKYIETLLNKKVINIDYFISHEIAPDEKALMEAYDGLMNKKNEYTGVIINWQEERK